MESGWSVSLCFYITTKKRKWLSNLFSFFCPNVWNDSFKSFMGMHFSSIGLFLINVCCCYWWCIVNFSSHKRKGFHRRTEQPQEKLKSRFSKTSLPLEVFQSGLFLWYFCIKSAFPLLIPTLDSASSPYFEEALDTLFENYSKCRIRFFFGIFHQFLSFLNWPVW